MAQTMLVTASDTNRRLAAEHKDLTEAAVEAINKLIRNAREFPVIVPKELLTEMVTVKHELLRRLKDEGGWAVETDGESPNDNPRTHYLLYHPHIRRGEKI